ncbi:hypothetical protein HELRODRAFT_164810 [Helobdella robusta]|uniref:DUF4190 domain-containing protein n=1 Tax=Helobdella robusta TaxID=6412 RepID=T1EVU2_HELRO|nr:hypothetical protein HELRODRAFT_164810 [Helobdella robusta]ESN92714.1 hypothetical protein HELRODRAFT_164810 [Helobdella robusta]
MEEAPLAETMEKKESYKSTEESEKVTISSAKEANEATASNGKPKDFVPAIMLSCFLFWTCGMLFGLIAMVLAVIGHYIGRGGNQHTAGKYLKASYIVSVVGIIVFFVLAIIFLIFWSKLEEQEKKNNTLSVYPF